MGIFVEGLSEFASRRYDCLDLTAGDERRAVGATRMNDVAAAATQCFRWCWNRGASHENNNNPVATAGRGHHTIKLNLVDLAVRKSGACESGGPHIRANKH